MMHFVSRAGAALLWVAETLNNQRSILLFE
jgi:hypothetical protein